MSINPVALSSILLQDFKRYLRWRFKEKYNTKIILKDFHIEVCEALIGVYEGRIKNLIINMPPRSGKTEIVNSFIEWAITKHPNSNYIMTSYSDTLISQSSQGIRDNLNSLEHRELFGILAKKDTQSKKLWKTEDNGGVYAVSSFGQITGHGAGTKSEGWGGCIVIDDPLKPNDAKSLSQLDKIKEWYQETLSNRKNSPDTPIIIIMQRLHVNDLIGHITRNEFKDIEDWEILKIPMIDEDNGVSRWEEFYPYENMMKIKASNAPYFSSQIQQEPVKKGGNLFKAEWLKPISRSLADTIKFEKKFVTADTALKDKEKHDYTVYSAWGIYLNKLYLLDMYRGKPTGSARENIANSFHDKWDTWPFFGFYIEQKASGIDLFQRMKENGKSVKEVERNTDKYFRAQEVEPYIEMHGVYYVDDISSISDFIAEYEQFPDAPHDDTMDTLMDAVEICYKDSEIDYSKLI